MESEKWSHSSGAISSSPVKDEINKDTGYSTRFKPKVFACIKKAVVFLLAEAQQMFWTFLNRWSWGLEHKTSHDLTKTSKSVISLLFIPATHSRANLVLLHEDSKVFLFLFKQQPALNSAFPRISDRMCTSKLSSLDCLYLDEICAAYWKRWEKLDCGLWKMCWFLQKTEKCNLSSWLTVRAYFGFHLLRGHHKITRQQNTQISSWDLQGVW